jgi:radical SAM-linked protein
MRLRITFAKTEAMRFTSHLDLHKTWERTFRRARLPLAYSQGFNPHPHINLASALPLGFTGDQEVIDVWLERRAAGRDRANAASGGAPGIDIRRVAKSTPKPTLKTIMEARSS